MSETKAFIWRRFIIMRVLKMITNETIHCLIWLDVYKKLASVVESHHIEIPTVTGDRKKMQKGRLVMLTSVVQKGSHRDFRGNINFEKKRQKIKMQKAGYYVDLPIDLVRLS